MDKAGIITTRVHLTDQNDPERALCGKPKSVCFSQYEPCTDWLTWAYTHPIIRDAGGVSLCEDCADDMYRRLGEI